MYFDIAHSAGKARAQALHNRRRQAVERALVGRLRAALDRVFAVAAQHARHGVFDVEHVVDGGRHELQRIVGSHYAAVGQHFLGLVEDAFARRQGHGKKDDNPAAEFKGMAEEFWRAFNGWAAADAFTEVQNIGAATKTVLRRLLRREAAEGSNYTEIADAIMAYAKGFNGSRAMRIARTETHRASTFAVNEAVRSTRVKFEREWVSMLDERTRSDHKKANGQRRGMNDPFDVGGDKLMFPGDPKGRASNTINCRCVILYQPARGAAWI